MYKNWKAICGISNVPLMWAIALLDTESQTGKEVTRALPEYFLETEPAQVGPFPLSLLKQEANTTASREGYVNSKYRNLVTDGVCAKYNIPVRAFARWSPAPISSDSEALPEELLGLDMVDEEKLFGTVVEYQVVKHVVVEVTHEHIWLAPAECIDVTR